MDSILQKRAIRALVKAFNELNRIRARDGVPYCRGGMKSDVDEDYFSSVVDDIDDVVTEATGRSAHCHPELYAGPPHDWCANSNCEICKDRYAAQQQ